MHNITVALGVIVTAGALFQFLTFAGIARLIRESNENTQVFIEADNILASRVAEVSQVVGLGIDLIASRELAKSLQDGDGE
jgi:hypothetical protein